jgi:hypothetical protein
VVEAIPSSNAPTGARTSADRVMRRLLRVEGPAQRGAIFGARDAMSRSILVSAVRCIITYLVVPVAVPALGVLDVVAAPLSIALCALAAFMSVRSVRRFFLADHPKRWAYTTFAAVVLVFLAVAVAADIATIAS